MSNRYPIHLIDTVIRLMIIVLLVVLSPFFTPTVLAQQDGHIGHDHAVESVQEVEHEDRADPVDHTEHDHIAEAEHHEDSDSHGAEEDAHAEHDDHARHDDHGEENSAIQIDSDTMKEYGIVVEEAASRPLSQALRLPGEVVFNADLVAHVTPSVSGIVQEVYPSVGDAVKSREVLAILSSRELASARSAFLEAKARLELEQETLDRQEALLSDRIGTETAVLEARKSVREQEIALNLAEHNLHALGESQSNVDTLSGSPDTVLSRYELRAPLGGVVIAREITRGEVVTVQPDEIPFVIADLSSVWVNLTVYQRDLVRVRAGMSVRIKFGHGTPDAQGTISFVSPAVDEQTRTATARIVLENPEGIWRPGLFVTGHVAIDETSGSIISVPKTSLQNVDEDTVIFVQSDDGFEPRPVQVGRSNSTHAEILSGLVAGERYVAANAFALKAELNRAALQHAGHSH